MAPDPLPGPPPHGGSLVLRLAPPAALPALDQRAAGLASLTVDQRTLADVDQFACGALSPLDGFLRGDDYRSVVHTMHLTDGLPWTIPIALALPDELRDRLREGDSLALRSQDGATVAVVDVESLYERDPRQEARLVYRTEDDGHPGVAALYREGTLLAGGPVTVLRRPLPRFPRYHLDPTEARAAFAARGWRTVVGFQTRNPVHRAHEHLQKVALEHVDGLFLQPLIGATKDDDIPADVRMRCYEVLLRGYYPADRVLLGTLPAAMRYAGPREAVFHAILRKNYGCTHFIVGRDHAGVGSYYGTYDAQRIFAEFDPAALGITPLFYENAFYCRRCAAMATARTCPHDDAARLTLSGTRVRELLRTGEPLPPEFSRPEVAAVLGQAFAGT